MNTPAFIVWYLGAGTIYILLYDISVTCVWSQMSGVDVPG